MMDKYRVHEVAKDLGVPNKDILALLGQYYPDEQRKHMTALSDAELNLVFEHYTQKNNLKNLNDYFELAQQQKAQAATPVAPAVAPATPAAPVAPVVAVAAAPAASAPAATTHQQQRTTPAPQQGLGRPAQQYNNYNNNNRQGRPAQQQQQQRQPHNNSQQQRPAQRPAPQQIQQHQIQQTQQTQQAQQSASNRVERPATRNVDMRSAQVNLDKYNERYEQIAPSNIAAKTQGPAKQKFTGRQQRGKPARSRYE